jgi:PHD/YefM family antitoxin component YafN of YafNO toxin-antitoxin module
MQKALSELVALPEAERTRLFEREPLLVTQNGEPHFVAQSLEAFESMVRRLRELESAPKPSHHQRRGKLILLRS